MTDSKDPNSILILYAQGPQQLEAAIGGLSDEALDTAPADGGWTIRQIVHHVVDGDDLWKTCVKAALGNENARFSLPWYWSIPQDRWAESWSYAGRAVEPSLRLFRANRAHIVQLLERVPGAWDRPVTVEWSSGESERRNVGRVIEMQAEHVRGHVEDIRRIRDDNGL